MDDSRPLLEVRSAAELREILGPLDPVPRDKVRTRLHALDREWLAHSPFCLMATSAADGTCDVSPKGDPPGFAQVLDDTHLALPERPGNRRADGFHNLLTNPHVGLIFLVPGRGDTLRINGRARLLRDAPFFDAMQVQGHRPRLCLLVEIEEVFFHCSKAFLRSDLWTPATWHPERLPTRAQISKTLERQDQPLCDLEHYYGPAYAKKLYG
jgi:PPOX class probable FMN-dependent enzyme